jgi:hypothetical protein
MKKIKVVLNAHDLSVPELIHRARTRVQNVADNATIFSNPNPALPVITLATDELETAAQEASEGGKNKVAIRNDKRRKLIELLTALGFYVEQTAAGDEEIIHLSGFEIKKESVRTQPEFEIEQGDHAGAVNIRVKARRKKTMYRWEHSSDAASWISDGITSACKTTIEGLARGIYWFRVILIDSSGEHEQTRQSFAVN